MFFVLFYECLSSLLEDYNLCIFLQCLALFLFPPFVGFFVLEAFFKHLLLLCSDLGGDSGTCTGAQVGPGRTKPNG